MDNKRNSKLAAQMQRILSGILQEDLNDPRVASMCSVLRVEVTNDLSYAKVYLSILAKNKEEEDECFAAILKASAFIRRQLAARLSLRKVPELRFMRDDSIAYSVKISQILHDLEKPKEE